MKKLQLVIVLVLFSIQAIKADHHDEHEQEHHKRDHLGFFVSHLIT